MEDLTFKLFSDDQGKVVRLGGRLDGNTYQELQQFLDRELQTKEQTVIFDCRDLRFISSAGLSVLLITAKRIDPKASNLAVANLQAAVRETFEIAGFSALFHVFDSLPEALSSLSLAPTLGDMD